MNTEVISYHLHGEYYQVHSLLSIWCVDTKCKCIAPITPLISGKHSIVVGRFNSCIGLYTNVTF